MCAERDPEGASMNQELVEKNAISRFDRWPSITVTALSRCSRPQAVLVQNDELHFGRVSRCKFGEASRLNLGSWPGWAWS